MPNCMVLPDGLTATKAVRAVLERPPATPECFASQGEWQGWLLSALASGEIITKLAERGRSRVNPAASARIVEAVFVSEIDHCADCTQAHKARMQAAGRCHPSSAEQTRTGGSLWDALSFRPRVQVSVNV